MVKEAKGIGVVPGPVTSFMSALEFLIKMFDTLRSHPLIKLSIVF